MIGHDTVERYLDRLSLKEPTPGGGAAAAIHAAQGAALICMVARYSQGPKYAPYEEDAAEVLQSAEALMRSAVRLGDADEKAFGGVISAYGLPRGSEEEAVARTEAIQLALYEAAAPPRELIAVCAAIIRLGLRLVDFCNEQVISDVAAAAEAARAAVATAVVNVEINAAGLRNPETVRELRDVVEEAESEILAAEGLARRVRKRITS